MGGANEECITCYANSLSCLFLLSPQTPQPSQLTKSQDKMENSEGWENNRLYLPPNVAIPSNYNNNNYTVSPRTCRKRKAITNCKNWYNMISKDIIAKEK